LQVVNSAFLRALEALSVLLKKVFLITMPALPPALSILIKCCKNKLAVSPVFLAEFVELQKTQAESENSWMVKISDIDQNTFDLSAKNPNAPIEPPLRHTQEILAEMKILDTESAEIIKVIKELI
jgi:hypothetical protein